MLQTKEEMTIQWSQESCAKTPVTPSWCVFWVVLGRGEGVKQYLHLHKKNKSMKFVVTTSVRDKSFQNNKKNHLK